MDRIEQELDRLNEEYRQALEGCPDIEFEPKERANCVADLSKMVLHISNAINKTYAEK